MPITMFVDSHITPLYHATIEATEAAIVNALLAAETTTGRRGVTAYGLEPELLLEAMRRFGAGPRRRRGGWPPRPLPLPPTARRPSSTIITPMIEPMMPPRSNLSESPMPSR